ncbi:MAG: dimethyl sulfoxide reductase anchor subunit [Chloroflexi bacterium]|nr:dimethyl sulfoxide reductase anchor subunit [Chloroflexota bacterium]
MNVREWALISFTILAQMSVGAFVVLGIVHFLAQRKAGSEEADRLSDRALLAIGPVMVLGLLVSLLHLGNPLNAYRAVANVGSSWLSREILFGALFAVVGGAFAIAQWRKIGSFAMRNLLAWLAALIGLVLVYSMASVYMLGTQPAWNTWATPISFFVTTLLLGVLAMGAAFVANYAYIQRKYPGCADAQCGLMRAAVRWIAVAAVVLVGIELLVVPLQVAYLAAAGGVAGDSAALMYGEFGLILALRLALVFIGAGVLGVFLYQNALSPGREKVLGYLTYAAFALVLVSEGLGRFIFYATHLRIGI